MKNEIRKESPNKKDELNDSIEEMIGFEDDIDNIENSKAFWIKP